jgi:hypothetical protein
MSIMHGESWRIKRPHSQQISRGNHLVAVQPRGGHGCASHDARKASSRRVPPPAQGGASAPRTAGSVGVRRRSGGGGGWGPPRREAWLEMQVAGCAAAPHATESRPGAPGLLLWGAAAAGGDPCRTDMHACSVARGPPTCVCAPPGDDVCPPNMSGRCPGLPACPMGHRPGEVGQRMAPRDGAPSAGGRGYQSLFFQLLLWHCPGVPGIGVVLHWGRCKPAGNQAAVPQAPGERRWWPTCQRRACSQWPTRSWHGRGVNILRVHSRCCPLALPSRRRRPSASSARAPAGCSRTCEPPVVLEGGGGAQPKQPPAPCPLLPSCAA